MAREIIDIIIQERGSARVVQSLKEVGSAADSTGRRVNLLQRAFRALGAGLAVRTMYQAIDSYTRMENQLKILGYTQDQVVVGMEKLYNIAQRTRAPFEQMVGLYGKLGQAGRELGKSEAELLRFTELTGKALAVQGTTANGARGVLIQLSQAMGEGIVRAQEFNSLIENARPLLLAAATGLDEAGGSVSKLRSIMLDGRLTSTAFFDAVTKGGALLDEQFGRTIPTISQGLTVLYNSFLQYIGTSQTVALVSKALGATLKFLSDNFNLIANAVVISGTLFAFWWGAQRMSNVASAVMGTVRAQAALNVALGATGFMATAAGGAVKLLQAAVHGLTAAIARNPLGLLLVAAVALGFALYNLRDQVISFGQTSASLGSTLAVLWGRFVGIVNDVSSYVAAFVADSVAYVSDLSTKVSGYFDSIGVDGRAMANFLIAVIVSFKDLWVGQFRILYEVAIAVFRGIADTGGKILSGLGAGITGDFAAAGKAFSSAFSGEAFNFDGVVSAAEATATKVGENFGRDFITEAGGAIAAGKKFIGDTMEGVMKDAAARDSALAKQAAQEFEFAPTSPTSPTGGGGKGKKAKDELSDLQKALKEIESSTTGALQKLNVEYEALNIALQRGTITQTQYAVKMAELGTRAAELAFEASNVAKSVRDANVAILQMKLDAGVGTFGEAFLVQLNAMTGGLVAFRQQAGTIFGEFFTSFSQGFADSFGRAIVYAEDLKESLSNVAKEALASLISGLVKLGVQWLLNAAIGNSIGAAAQTATSAQAAAAASAWAPAAALASLATSGANAAGANAAVAGTMAITKTLAAAGGAFANGGMISAPGGPRDDKGIAAVSNGEYVINAASTKRFLPLIEAINAGGNLSKYLPAYRDGGEFTNGQGNTNPVLARNVREDVATMDRAASRGTQGATPNVDASVTVVNVDDPKKALDALQSGEGARIIWNHLERNPTRLRQISGAN